LCPHYYSAYVSAGDGKLFLIHATGSKENSRKAGQDSGTTHEAQSRTNLRKTRSTPSIHISPYRISE